MSPDKVLLGQTWCELVTLAALEPVTADIDDRFQKDPEAPQ